MTNIDDIAKRHAAALPGPYFWDGNTDNHSVALSTRMPGEGVCEILGTRRRDRRKDDVEVQMTLSHVLEGDPQEALYFAQQYADYDTQLAFDEMTVESIWDDESGEYKDDFVELLRDIVVHNWTVGEDGETLFDERLFITRRDENDRFAHLALAEDQVVYSVARNQGLPDDTLREHPKVYRADVCDVNNPTGKFLASSWQDVQTLLAEVERLQAIVADQTLILRSAPGLMWLHDREHSDLRVTTASRWFELDYALQSAPADLTLARSAWVNVTRDRARGPEIADLKRRIREEWPELGEALDGPRSPQFEEDECL